MSSRSDCQCCGERKALSARKASGKSVRTDLSISILQNGTPRVRERRQDGYSLTQAPPGRHAWIWIRENLHYTSGRSSLSHLVGCCSAPSHYRKTGQRACLDRPPRLCCPVPRVYSSANLKRRSRIDYRVTLPGVLKRKCTPRSLLINNINVFPEPGPGVAYERQPALNFIMVVRPTDCSV